MYGISEQVNVGINVPFAWNKMNIASTGYESRGEGLGDIILTARYLLVDIEPYRFVPYAEFSLKMPTGEDYSRDNRGSNYLLRGIQPGTGTWDSIFGIGFNKRWIELNTYGRMAYAFTLIKGNNGGYTTDAFSGSLGLGYPLIWNIGVSLTLNGIRTTITNNSGTTTITTISGGNWLYLIPGISFTPWMGFTGYTTISLPIYMETRSRQLVEDYQIGLGIIWKF